MSERVLVDAEALTALTEQLAEQIASAGEEPLVIVGIREGGDVLARRLEAGLRSRDIAIDGIGALDITLYRDDFGHRQHWPEIRDSDIPVDLTRKNVLLVDDVLFTGRTIRAALAALLDYGRPATVRLAVLIDRGNRQLPIQPDYCGQVIDLDRDELCLVRFVEQGHPRDEVIAVARPDTELTGA
ncbi:MAG: bifunctional pyr operon transcriptional regulator/uracil phosphoribosyltransferase PyrR [Candidatus Dadabacteria bacterium]|nr:MAG: bifunctional pyr operon transcriptional regulator/uracil phosphoribosyltransferase PyrR [Candidatus Dadabacteria bacterium]